MIAGDNKTQAKKKGVMEVADATANPSKVYDLTKEEKVVVVGATSSPRSTSSHIVEHKSAAVEEFPVFLDAQVCQSLLLFCYLLLLSFLGYRYLLFTFC